MKWYFNTSEPPPVLQLTHRQTSKVELNSKGTSSPPSVKARCLERSNTDRQRRIVDISFLFEGFEISFINCYTQTQTMTHLQ